MCRAREFTAAVQRLGQRRAWHEALQVLESMESQALQATFGGEFGGRTWIRGEEQCDNTLIHRISLYGIKKVVDVSSLSLSFSLFFSLSLSFSLFLSLSLPFSLFLNRSSKAKRVSGPKRQVFLNECNCRRVFANI